METVSEGGFDAGMPGIAGIIAGILIIVLAVLLATRDLPTAGGNIYGSRGQSIVLLAFVGVCCLVLGYLDLQSRE
jgi:hypothetical protein